MVGSWTGPNGLPSTQHAVFYFFSISIYNISQLLLDLQTAAPVAKNARSISNFFFWWLTAQLRLRSGDSTVLPHIWWCQTRGPTYIGQHHFRRSFYFFFAHFLVFLNFPTSVTNQLPKCRCFSFPQNVQPMKDRASPADLLFELLHLKNNTGNLPKEFVQDID
jgi:hypothetical protein